MSCCRERRGPRVPAVHASATSDSRRPGKQSGPLAGHLPGSTAAAGAALGLGAVPCQESTRHVSKVPGTWIPREESCFKLLQQGSVRHWRTTTARACKRDTEWRRWHSQLPASLNHQQAAPTCVADRHHACQPNLRHGRPAAAGGHPQVTLKNSTAAAGGAGLTGDACLTQQEQSSKLVCLQ